MGSFADVGRRVDDRFCAALVRCRHNDTVGSECVSNDRQRKLASDIGCRSAAWYTLFTFLAFVLCAKLKVGSTIRHDTIRYDTMDYINVRLNADE